MKNKCFLKRVLNSTKIASLLIPVISFSVFADASSISIFNQLFKIGQYSKSLEVLEKSNEKDFPSGQIFYLKGICHSKLQEYDKAVKNFEIAIKNKNENADLQYEYGQALYAINELKASRKAFKESASIKYNTQASIYYVAHISQILEELPEAKENYYLIIRSPEADSKIKQIANFQLSETLLLMMREKFKTKDELEKNVEKYIIPLLKRSFEIDKSTQIAGAIDLRLSEVLKEFNLDPDLLTNGKRISSKRYSGYLLGKIKFDDNISLTNEENNVQQSKKESFIYETEAYTKYDFLINKKFIVSPEIRLNFVQHGDQDNSEVYQNDTFSINTNLKNKYEHLAFTHPASLLFDIEFGKNLKDWNKTHKREAYSTTVNLGVGESFNYFSVGDTSVKLKLKKFIGETVSLSNHTTMISADQTIAFSNQHLLIALFEADFINNFNNTSSNTNTYLTRFDYLIPEIMPKYTLGIALATTLTDTKEEDPTRGTEVSLNPSIDLSKEINQKMKLSINYDYTRSNSKSSSYDYNKNVFSTEFRYSF